VTHRSLRIAWLGPAPRAGREGGALGAATEILDGLAGLGHHIDCFLPAREHGQELSPQLLGLDNLRFVWGTSSWSWNRWYSRTKLLAFASGLIARGLASLRLRREVVRRHRQLPYDLIFQQSNIESLAVPSRIAAAVPIVMRPDTHIAGELRSLIEERSLALRCQPRHTFATVLMIMAFRSILQRARIRRANLLICISGVFRDHIMRDYGFPRAATVVVANPVRLARFADTGRNLGEQPTVLVLGRISARKGIDDVVALAKLLLEREVDIRLRIIGGPSLWSDYTKLLDDLPGENTEYVPRVPPSQIPAELARSDVLLQPSKYEPFGCTVAEALAAGVPVVATTEVGAVEGVDRAVATVIEPGDVDRMAAAIATMVAAVRRDPDGVRAKAQAEAERLFAPEVVCEQISRALQELVETAPLEGVDDAVVATA
jgi:glycosyltransferase involved in cell wall biosynthesis